MIANLILVSLVLFPNGWPFDSRGRELTSMIGSEVSQDDAHDLIRSLRVSASRLGAFAERAQAQVHENPAEGLFQTDRIALAEMNAWSAYGRRCAVTGWRVECTLAATYLRPPDQGGPPSVENMLLLRQDFAALHQADLIAFNDEGKLLVSTSLAAQDARVYGELGKLRLRPSVFVSFRPDPVHIRWRLARYHRRQAEPDWDGGE